MLAMSAWACGERTIAASSWSASVRSSKKRPCPFSRRGSSRRSTDCPMANSPMMSDLLRRTDHAGLAGDAAVVLDAAVAREIEDRLLAESGCVEVADGDDQLVVL